MHHKTAVLTIDHFSYVVSYDWNDTTKVYIDSAPFYTPMDNYSRSAWVSLNTDKTVFPLTGLYKILPIKLCVLADSHVTTVEQSDTETIAIVVTVAMILVLVILAGIVVLFDRNGKQKQENVGQTTSTNDTAVLVYQG